MQRNNEELIIISVTLVKIVTELSNVLHFMSSKVYLLILRQFPPHIIIKYTKPNKYQVILRSIMFSITETPN